MSCFFIACRRLKMVKNLFTLLVVLCFFGSAGAKELGKIKAIDSKANYLYVGIDNKLRVFNKLVPLASLTMETDNGVIFKEEEGFYIHPAKPGKSNIKAFNIKNGDSVLIAEGEFIVYKFPKPKLVINGRVTEENDIVTKQELINSDSLGLDLHFSSDLKNIDNMYEIISFSIGWVYGNHYMQKRSAGTRLNSQCKQLVSNIPPGTETVIRVMIKSNDIIYKKRPIFRIRVR